MSEIRAIKERLLRTEDAYKRKNILWEERAKIEAELAKTREKQVGSALKEDIESRSLKQKKIEIDHLLDEVEDHDEELIVVLRKELVTTILKENPEERLIHQGLTDRIEANKELEKKISDLAHGCQLIANSIGSAVAHWDRPVLARILRYIFGPSPTEAINDHLEKASERSQTVLELIVIYVEHNPEDIRAGELSEQLSIFINAFLKEREERWSFTKLKLTYKPSLKALERFIEQLRVQQNLAKESLVEGERDLQKWLEKFC